MYVTATPYTVQYGMLKVPDDTLEKEYQKYLKAHFDEVQFGVPELDYRGTDIKFDEIIDGSNADE